MLTLICIVFCYQLTRVVHVLLLPSYITGDIRSCQIFPLFSMVQNTKLLMQGKLLIPLIVIGYVSSLTLLYPFFFLHLPRFQFEYQVINVPDYGGQGETQPSSYFYQNLGEAEFLIATFMYMVLIG